MPESLQRVGLVGRIVMSLLLLMLIPGAMAGFMWLNVRAPYLYPLVVIVGAVLVASPWTIRGQGLTRGNMLLVALPSALMMTLMSVPLMAAMFREDGSFTALGLVALNVFLSSFLMLLAGLWLAHVLARVLGRMNA